MEDDHAIPYYSSWDDVLFQRGRERAWHTKHEAQQTEMNGNP